MAKRERTPTFFDAETRIVEIDATLLSLSEETVIELGPEHEIAAGSNPPQPQSAHDDPTRIREYPIPRGMRGRTTVEVDANSPLGVSAKKNGFDELDNFDNLAEGSDSGKFNRDDYQLASFSQVMTALRNQPSEPEPRKRKVDLEATTEVPRLARGSDRHRPLRPDSLEATYRRPQDAFETTIKPSDYEAAPNNERTELRPTTMPAGPYCAVAAPELAAYQITHEIASGGMGIVYEAYHRQSGKRVAVKYMRGVSAQQAKLVKRFLGEGIAASRIDHPGVAEVYDYGHDNDGVPYLVMEYLEGENLGDRLTRGPVGSHEFLEIARQLTDILSAAHHIGIVHRDLKPDNIFLVAGDRIHVKLLDFGVAKFLDDQDLLGATREGQVLGTPFYMSPEQCSGDSVDRRSDVYSLGCVFYQMLAGKVPFPGNIFDVVIGHRQKKALPLSSLCAQLPPALIHLIESMMEKHVDDRPATIEDVGAAIASIASGKHEAPVSAKTQNVRRGRRHSRAPRQRLTAHSMGVMKATPRQRRKLIPLTFAGIALAAATILTLSVIL